MRVLWTHNFDPGKPNAGIFMHIFADGMRKMGLEVDLMYLGNLQNPVEIRRAIAKLKFLSAHYDLIHAQYGSVCAWVTSHAQKVPRMLTLRGSDLNTYDGSNLYYYWHTRMARWFTRIALDHFDRIITVSQRMNNEIRQINPQTLSVTIPDPVDLNIFYPRNKTELKKKFHPDSTDERWVLFNTNLLKNPIKRYNLAVEAVKIAAASNPKIRLKIATNIPHRQMPEFVAACDLILCTSTAEGWPNSVKEALACNIPFVSTDVGDLWMIARKEPSCKICPPDPQQLADAILEILSLPPDYNLRKYAEEMDLETTCQKLLKLYQELTE